MIAPTLFGVEQHQELARVSGKISEAIISFTQTLWRAQRSQFHADELREYVAKQVGITAPGSADRVLRDLRKAGRLRYSVVNRRQSLYRLF